MLKGMLIQIFCGLNEILKTMAFTADHLSFLPIPAKIINRNGRECPKPDHQTLHAQTETVQEIHQETVEN
jgi:hypothetical protein